MAAQNCSFLTWNLQYITNRPEIYTTTVCTCQILVNDCKRIVYASAHCMVILDAFLRKRRNVATSNKIWEVEVLENNSFELNHILYWGNNNNKKKNDNNNSNNIIIVSVVSGVCVGVLQVSHRIFDSIKVQCAADVKNWFCYL